MRSAPGEGVHRVAVSGGRQVDHATQLACIPADFLLVFIGPPLALRINKGPMNAAPEVLHWRHGEFHGATAGPVATLRAALETSSVRCCTIRRLQ